MTKKPYETEFLHYVFKNLGEAPGKHETSIEARSMDGNGGSLTIDLEKQVVLGKENKSSDLDEYLKKRLECRSDTEYEDFIHAQLSEYRLEKEKQERQPFKRDGYWWKISDGADKYRAVTNFDITINAIIERYNPDKDNWDKFLDCYITYKNAQNNIVHSRNFTLQPKTCLSVKDFQQAIFEVSFQECFFKRDQEVKSFFAFLANEPGIKWVREYDHFGFIKYNRDQYYLAKNCLVYIPSANDSKETDVNTSIDLKEVISSETQLLIAPDEDGYFKIPAMCGGSNHYISLDHDLQNAPVFDLGKVEHGYYRDDMEALYHFDIQEWNDQFKEKMRLMVGGQDEHCLDGHLLWAYMNSFHFFDDIFHTFYHTVFVYLHGEKSSGKGRMADVMLTYFGMNATQSESVPTLRSIENKLSTHSKIPAWLDEYDPPNGPKLQYFNLWYELKIRGTSSAANRRKQERKETRTSLFFSSNYQLKPDEQQDHLRSRNVRMLFSKIKRGDESNYTWLTQHRRELQYFFFKMLQRHPTFDRKLFRNELIEQKKLMKAGLNKKLKKQQELTGYDYDVVDREIENMAALVVTAMELDTNMLTLKNMLRVPEDTYAQTLIANLRTGKAMPLHQYAIDFLAAGAREVGDRDPLSEFLTWVDTAIDTGLINHRHYNWFKHSEGNMELKVFVPKIWKIYEKDMGLNTVNQNMIYDAFKTLNIEGEFSNVYWKDQETNKKYQNKGVAIPLKKLNDRFFYGFHRPDLINGGTRKETQEKEPILVDVETSDESEDKAPF